MSKTAQAGVIEGIFGKFLDPASSVRNADIEKRRYERLSRSLPTLALRFGQ